MPPISNDSQSDKNHSMVYLNVYDLTPINNYLYWLGLGIFHSGIEVYGMEYGFGAHDYPSSGVFQVEPRNCPGFVFRRSILLGSIDMSPDEFQTFVEQISNEFHGDTYHLISKNCNHFTDEVSLKLTGNQIPGWVNRLARLGSFCNCLLPECLRTTRIEHLSVDKVYSEDGSDSDGSEASDVPEEEYLDHQLLLSPNNDVAYLKDQPVKLTMDSL